MSPRPNFRGRLRPALIFELGRIGSEHLPNDLPRDPQLPADRLDRPLLNEIRPADLRNRLHDQHPELGLHVPWKPVWTLIPGVPFGCRSPRKRGPYSTPIHNQDATPTKCSNDWCCAAVRAGAVFAAIGSTLLRSPGSIRPVQKSPNGPTRP